MIEHCIFLPFETQVRVWVVKLDLSEAFQPLEIWIKNGWLTVAGGAINRVSKSQILQLWRGDTHASMLFHFMTVTVCPN